MSRYKILMSDSNREDETGKFSLVEISTDLGNFSAIASLHNGDNFSNFLGCEVAESKAVRKYIKRKIANLKERLNEFENFEKMLLCCKAYNPKSFEARRIRRRKYELMEQIGIWEIKYDSLSQKTVNNLKAREQILKRVKSKNDTSVIEN